MKKVNLQIGPVGVLALTLAVTEAFKQIFNVQGKWNQLVAVITGALLTAISYGINNQLLPEYYVPYVQWVVISLGGGLGAIGLFDFATKEIPEALKSFVDMLE